MEVLALIWGSLFGFALVFMFLVLMLDLKLAVWVSVGISTAFMGAFLVFGSLGVTITMISLFGLIIVLVVVFEPGGLYGRWMKIRFFFETFPYYRKSSFVRQKSYLKTERMR